MSITTGRVVADHELYRIFLFLNWETLEPEEATVRRIRMLGGELRRLGWMPDGKELPDRADTADWKRRLWDAKALELTDGWFKKLDAISYPEELLIYVGLWRREQRTDEDWENWIHTAAAQWESKFPECLRTTAFASPETTDHGERPRLLGQGWVWTGEWDSEPTEGWDIFGQSAYGPGRYSVFPWGVLGFPDAPEDKPGGLPRFDLHTTTDPACCHGRNLYLRWELPRLLSCFLKADQFLRGRYQGLLRPKLDADRSKLMELTRPRSAYDESDRMRPATERARAEINAVTCQVYDLTDVLTSLEVDARSVELALDEVRRALLLGPEGGRSSPQPWPVASLELLVRQMRASLDYGRMTVAVADRLLQKHSIFGEIEQTRATEQLTKLGVIIMIIGATFSAMQLTTNGTVRNLLFSAGLMLCLLVYRERVGDAWRSLKIRVFGP